MAATIFSSLLSVLLKKNVTGYMMEYDESLYNQIKRPKRKQNHYAYVLLIVNVTMQ